MSSRAQASLSAVLFLGPQLHCIHFDFDGGGEEKSISLASVVSLATHSLPAVVEELTLTGWFPPMVTDLISRFSNLRRLKVDNTNVEFEAFLLFLPAISHSVRLTSLVLRWAHSLSGRQIDRLPLSAPLLLPVGAFPALKHLDVTGDFESIRQLVSTLDSSQITTLSMNFDSGPRSFRYGRDSGIREWRLLFDLVSGRWGSSLERISIDTGNHHGRAEFEELLHGFCEVRNLREFRLLASLRSPSKNEISRPWQSGYRGSRSWQSVLSPGEMPMRSNSLHPTVCSTSSLTVRHLSSWKSL
jgi:hypothetical protein